MSCDHCDCCLDDHDTVYNFEHYEIEKTYCQSCYWKNGYWKSDHCEDNQDEIENYNKELQEKEWKHPRFKKSMKKYFVEYKQQKNKRNPHTYYFKTKEEETAKLQSKILDCIEKQKQLNGMHLWHPSITILKHGKIKLEFDKHRPTGWKRDFRQCMTEAEIYDLHEAGR
jgi:hypothetical protein